MTGSVRTCRAIRTERRTVPILYEPKYARLILPGRCCLALFCCSATRSSPTRWRICASRTSPRASDSSARTAGFDVVAVADRIPSKSSYGARVPRRLAQYAAGVGARHRVRDLLGFIIGSRVCRQLARRRELPHSMSRSCAMCPLLLQLFGWYFAVMMALAARRRESRCAALRRHLNGAVSICRHQSPSRACRGVGGSPSRRHRGRRRRALGTPATAGDRAAVSRCCPYALRWSSACRC